MAPARQGNSKAATRRRSWKAAFLEALGRTANVTVACREARISRDTAYEHEGKDKKFAGAWKQALDEAVELLEEEVRRRAQDGVEEPVFYEGEQVTTVRKYSDTLAMFLLKARRPEKYRERIGVKNEDPKRPADPTLAADAIAHFLGEVEPAPPGGSGGGGEAGAA